MKGIRVKSLQKNIKKPKQTGKDYYDKIPSIYEGKPSKLREQISRGLGAFLIIAASIVFYFLFLRFTNFFEGFSEVLGILQPVIYGIVIAYLLNPMVKKVEFAMLQILQDKYVKEQQAKKVVRSVGIGVSILVFLFIIFLLINMIIPELISSIQKVLQTLPNQINHLVDTISQIEISNSILASALENTMNEGAEYLREWVQNNLLARVNEIMSNLTVGVISIVQWVFNFIMGLIISIYILASKEMFLGQCKKAIYALLPVRNANITLHIAKKSNEIFGGFIIGKIIDSIIIGVICCIGLSLMNMPYTLLISVIVGVTNVIPFFGPFIGAIPSAILILLQEPIQCLYFVLFIIFLQQLDGNIIGPKILGDSTGLSAFWVIVAILLGGGLFGFPGMVIGVPTFAVIYYIVGLFLNQRLERKKLPTDSATYDELSYVDVTTGAFVSSEEHMKCTFEEDELKENESKENESKENESKKID